MNPSRILGSGGLDRRLALEKETSALRVEGYSTVMTTTEPLASPICVRYVPAHALTYSVSASSRFFPTLSYKQSLSFIRYQGLMLSRAT